jgi:hypothetical protein
MPPLTMSALSSPLASIFFLIQSIGTSPLCPQFGSSARPRPSSGVTWGAGGNRAEPCNRRKTRPVKLMRLCRWRCLCAGNVNGGCPPARRLIVPCPAQQDHLGRNARVRCSRPSDLLLGLQVRPLDEDQRRPMAGWRAPVRYRAALCPDMG